MSTGNFSFELPGYKIWGNFKNGICTDGIVETPKVISTGTFINYKLHGDACSMIVDRKYKYSGKFEHDILRHGTKYSDKILEEGKYDKAFRLSEGIKYFDDRKEEGKFNYVGSLSVGTITWNHGRIDKGLFSNTFLVDGTIVYDNFEARVQYKLDIHDISRYLLTNCIIKYNGKITDLNREQLELFCCRGTECTKLHKLYKAKLYNYDSKSIDLLKYMDISKVDISIEDIPIFLRIIENIKTM
jgi:hypothetical protein